MKRRLRQRLRSLCSLGLSIAAFGTVYMPSASANASVNGRNGIEIEGAKDRRGLYLGPGVTVGASFIPGGSFVPGMAGSFHIGGGITKNLLIGANVEIARFFTPVSAIAVQGDLEVTGFVWKGFYLRGGIGAGAVPLAPSNTVVAIGGKFGAGYELWLNQSAALSMGLHQDMRILPGPASSGPASSSLRHGTFAGLRFTWY